MVVKFFSDKKGGGIGSLNYLLDKKRVEQGTARTLSGDEHITRSLIASMSQKHKTCVGCLSFEEANIDENTKKELMQDFERVLMTDEMQGHYNILWVEHTDKGRLELNFVIPKIDLQSGRAFNPYFHKIDYSRKDLWTDYVNLKYSFTDPKDPAKEQSLQGSKKQYELIKDYEALDKLLQEQVANGSIKSRQNIIELLKQSNIEVTRAGKDYISVKLPQSKKAKRFKGGIYDEQFTSPTELRAIHSAAKERQRAYNARDNQRELERVKQELDELIQSKAKFYRERNNKYALQISKRSRNLQMEQYSNELYSGDAYDDDFKHSCVVSVDNALSGTGQQESDKPERRELYLRAQGSDDRAKGQHLHQDQVMERGNDNIRSRADSRDREITRRTGASIDAEREADSTEQKALTRKRGLDDKIREFVKQLRELENTIRQAVERISKKIRARLRDRELKNEVLGGRGLGM
jgi:3-methyladenine DNA glycosylase AlkC